MGQSSWGPLAPATTIPLQGRTTEGASWAVDAYPVSGPPYRDFALFLQDEDEVIGTAQMPYREQVHGLVGLNYGKEPLARRLVANKDTARLFRSAVHGDPAAPLLEAFAGDRVRLHLLSPSASKRMSSAWRDTAGR